MPQRTFHAGGHTLNMEATVRRFKNKARLRRAIKTTIARLQKDEVVAMSIKNLKQVTRTPKGVDCGVYEYDDLFCDAAIEAAREMDFRVYQTK